MRDVITAKRLLHHFHQRKSVLCKGLRKGERAVADYCKKRGADWLLCSCLSACITVAVCAGFILTDALSSNPATVFTVCAIAQAVFLLLACRRWLTVMGIAAGAVVAAGVVAYIRLRQPLADESANSLFVFFLVAVLSSLLIFLLGRTRPGIAVLFLLGNLVQAGSRFLEFPTPVWAFILFNAAVFALFFYRVCMIRSQQTELGSVRLGRYLCQMAALCLASLLLAGGAYLGVVRPLDPPTQDLKLITQLRSMDLLQVLGVSSTKTVLLPDTGSESTPDRTELGNKQGEEENSEPELTPEPTQDPAETENDTQSTPQGVTTIRYPIHTSALFWLIPCAVVLLIAAVVLLVKRDRRLWQARVRKLPYGDGVINYYRFFLKRLKRLGIARAGHHTLRQFYQDSGIPLQPFEGEQATFAGLTAVYERALYGQKEITPEEYLQFEAFYGGFRKTLRKEAGTLKYVIKAMWL